LPRCGPPESCAEHRSAVRPHRVYRPACADLG
jgi:hypothetical protein